jgi:hypothetical protein
LYRGDLILGGWPNCDSSEGMFTQQLLANPQNTFAYYGLKEDLPWVIHIGEERTGVGY